MKAPFSASPAGPTAGPPTEVRVFWPDGRTSPTLSDVALTTQFEERSEASETMPVRRFVQVVGALLITAGALGVSGMGCVDPEATFYVRNVSSFDESCLCTTDGTTRSSGTFESAFGGEYQLCLIVTNGLDSLEDRNRPRAETNHVEIYAIDVDIEAGQGLADSAACPLSFTIPSKGFASPESDGLVIVPGIPQCVSSQLYAALAPGETRTVIATFIVRGHTTGGDELETPEYAFPITVGKLAYCYGQPLESDEELGCAVGSDSIVPSNLCDQCRADTDCRSGTCDLETRRCAD